MIYDKIKLMEVEMLKIIQSTKFYMPIIYIIIGTIIYNIIARSITRVNKINIKYSNKEIIKRKTTVISLIKNIIKYIIIIIIVILILNVYGVNTTSIIASLGAVSVIIGLAFQDIIKDLLAGIFIILDNQYAVGDWVEINGFKGEVIALGLKTTKIKAYTGEVKIVSNSSFIEVINYNLNNSKIMIKIPFSYDLKIEKIEEALKIVKNKIEQNKNVYNMELLGVEEFNDSAINYIIAIECVPMTHIVIKREALKLIKQTLDEQKIEIPYNQLDIHIKEQSKK